MSRNPLVQHQERIKAVSLPLCHWPSEDTRELGLLEHVAAGFQQMPLHDGRAMWLHFQSCWI